MWRNTLTQQERKIVTLASLGGMLEFYDFVIYGIFAVYFSHQFFPSHHDLIVVLQSYFIFVLGYIARPIGGIIFSHIGDEYGRKKVLIITIILMGAASLGMGLLPNYAHIGIAAPLLLLILRLTQGLALGGELPSTYVYISETMAKKRGIAFGITMTGVNGGLLLGMLVNQALNYLLTPEQLTAFGWRLPFIFGGLICIISYRIRQSLHETAVFEKIHDRPKLPLFHLFQNHFVEFLAGTAVVAVMSSLVVVAVVFMPTYLHEILKLDNHYISNSMTLLMVINLISIYTAGRVAQHYRPDTILKVLGLLCCFLIPLSYFLIYSSHTLLGLLILGVLEGIAAMITPYIVTTIFESRIRLTGVALCYNIGFTLFGAMAPLIITNLIKANYNIYLSPCIYLLVMVLICGFGLRYLNQK
jgi:MFS family permease